MGERVEILPLDDKPVSWIGKAARSVIRMLPSEKRKENFREEIAARHAANADNEGFALLPYCELLAAVSTNFHEEEKFLLENAWVVKKHLDEAGYIAAPDSMLERRRLKPGDNVVLYRSDDPLPFIRQRPYKKGLLLVKFLTLAFKPLSESEMSSAGKTLEMWVKNERYRRHLGGLLRWFNARRRLLDRRTVRSFNEILTPEEKRSMAIQLIVVAASRGASLAPNATRQLERLSAMCGIESAEMHSLLHRLQCGGAATGDTGTAVARNSGKNVKEETLLDPRRLETIESSTAKVRGLLAEVLDSGEDEPASESSAVDVASEVVRNPLLPILKGKDMITVSEIENELGSASGKLSALLEKLNDEAYEKTGDAAAEQEGDMIYVSSDIVDTLLDD